MSKSSSSGRFGGNRQGLQNQHSAVARSHATPAMVTQQDPSMARRFHHPSRENRRLLRYCLFAGAAGQ